MKRFLFLFAVLFGLGAVEDRPMDPKIDGVYELVSSRFEKLDWSAPGWKGQMIVKDGRYSRVYQEISPTSEISFHCNAGTLEYKGKMVKMKLEYSNFRDIVGMTFENRVTWSPDRNQMTLNSEQKGNNFREVWKRVEK